MSIHYKNILDFIIHGFKNMSSISHKYFKKGCVVIGMSGGVDSSVAAWLLKQQGYQVIGLFMKNWQDKLSYCSIKKDFLDAVSIADYIGIEFDYVDFSLQYKDRVFKNFLNEYSAGRTPNPDVFCNSEIKFSSFMEHAFKLGADYIATGHYAKIVKIGKKIHLARANDAQKDQSYFLYRLNQAQLLNTIFPLGEISKSQVRRIAQEVGLHNFDKKDSTGICFIGKRPFKKFLSNFIPFKPGPILISENKNIIGNHDGLPFYTIGQRKGLKIGGIKNYAEDKNVKTKNNAWYVASKNFGKNALIVVQGNNHPKLFSKNLYAGDATWISEFPPKDSEYKVKIRFQHTSTDCYLKVKNFSMFELIFSEPQWAVTPGQSAVLYEKDICLGGGIIY